MARPTGNNARYWWCVTLNSDLFGDEGVRAAFVGRMQENCPVDEAGKMQGPLDYYIFQFERGHSGNPHLQGTFHFSPKVRFSGVQLFFARFADLGPVNPHIEPTHDPAAACEYCRKEDTRIEGPFEAGICPKDGKSSALVRAALLLTEGATLRFVAKSYSAEFVRHHRGLQALANIMQEPEDEGAPPAPPDVRLYFGPSRTGKSTLARTWREPGWRTYVFPVGDQLWADGYAGQELVVIDEFHGQLPLDQLLRLLDGFVIRVPVKGSFAWFRPKRVAITSTSDPGTWYNFHKRLDRWPALLRRITSLALYHERPDDQRFVPNILTGDELVRWKSLLVPRLDAL